MNKFGDKLFVCSTDEPITVLRQFKHFTLVRRPVMGQNGIRYKFGLFFNVELESLQEQTARTLATIKIRNDIAQADMDADASSLAMPALQFKKSTN